MEEEAASERKSPREGDADEAPSDAAPSGEDAQYVYLPIGDALKAPGARVCLFAAVSEIGAVVPNCGTDFTLTLRIVDQSRTAGIAVTFSAEDATLLPSVKSSGDVISLHNVVITMHGEFLVAFIKKSSSFALFEGKVSAECSPYLTSTKYHGSKHDNKLLTQMRTWLASNPLGPKDLEFQLCNLQCDSTFDLVCKVLHLNESNGKWTFYVWDGTDTRPIKVPAMQDCCLDARTVEVYPLDLDVQPLPREVLCTMPCVGTVMRVFSDKFVKEVLHFQNNSYWARFCNITCSQEFGIWKGILLASSKVCLLAHEDGSVVDRQKRYDSRIANQDHRLPMQRFPETSDITDTEYKTAGYSTLMESLTHEQVIHKLKTMVRVVAAQPCGACGLRSPSIAKFGLVLTLEDPTARIHVFVDKDEMIVKFFGGFLTAEGLTKKMNKLLGIPKDSEEGAHVTRNPPWMWCCLKSYCLDENNPWGSRNYRIFATKIRD